MRTPVEDKPRVAPCEILTGTPDLITSNGVGPSWRGVDAVLEGDDLEESLLDQLENPVAEFDGRGVRGGIVLEPVKVEVKLLDFVVVIGLNVG